MLKPLLVLSAAILFEIALAPSVFTLAAAPLPQAAAPGGGNPVKPTPATMEKVKKIYAIDCAVCHGDNGNGKTDLAKDMQLSLTDWTDPKSLSGKSDQELFDMIRNGKDKMPPEETGRAKNDDVWGLVYYIRSMSKAQTAQANKTGN